MTLVEAFQTVCQINWGTVPQWLTAVAVFVGLWYTARQLRHYRSVREIENILSISDSTIAHNATFLASPNSLRTIQILEKLNVPTSSDEADMYWAARHVHINHLNLAWRVWELAGRCGKTMSSKYDGWERFARDIIAKKLIASHRAVENGVSSPEDLAASDLWSGLNTYESTPSEFVKWLSSIAKSE